MKLRMLALAAPLALTVGMGQALATTISLDGSPLQLNHPPIVQAGRVFVPLRGVFSALGASVVYQNGTINATRRERTVSLHIGSTVATIAGAEQQLDSPPFIEGETTYVPLRFVAQALGAYVSYNNVTSAVSISQREEPHQATVRYSNLALVNVAPADGASTYSAQPTISANFSRKVDPNSVHVALDGLDVTMMTTRSETGIIYKPSSPLQAIRHQVVVTGHDDHNQRFSLHWSFMSGKNAESTSNVNALRVFALREGQDVPRNFYVSGQTTPHARVHIICGAIGRSPESNSVESGSFIADTDADAFGHFSQNVIANAPVGGKVTLTVSATDPHSGLSGSRTLHLRISGY